ncbi:MAG: gamma-glutamyl-gamma-aminobutyrate hydrolase family protein [Candidatus Dormibacteria bacterium]
MVGITCGSLLAAGQQPRYGTNQVYAAAVKAGGGTAVMIPPGGHSPVDLLARVDALLLPGGADVHPRFYGMTAGEHLGRTDEARDEMELSLVTAARRRGIPVLGICRGLQTINVACGGTLYQDIKAGCAGALDHNPFGGDGRNRLAHGVEIVPGSWFATAAGATHLEVNSLHHQAAEKVGRGLRVSATSPDGIIEGLETEDHRVVAIQCHAEELLTLPWARRLFRRFVNSARA